MSDETDVRAVLAANKRALDYWRRQAEEARKLADTRERRIIALAEERDRLRRELANMVGEL